MSDTTAAEAARKAAEWAHRAEMAYDTAEQFHGESKEAGAHRGQQSTAAVLAEASQDWEGARKKAAEMANMWANVAGALQLAELGEHS
ncbi:hypothetical protein [Streptomyces ardesiacus]|uniref:hypothetical protein n=1 Tax=Streptomyces ardesiacus TaxID=285564 RepID=UPI000D599C9E|nr:hypothetical protein [Streptomyces ardesiacus]